MTLRESTDGRRPSSRLEQPRHPTDRIVAAVENAARPSADTASTATDGPQERTRRLLLRGADERRDGQGRASSASAIGGRPGRNFDDLRVPSRVARGQRSPEARALRSPLPRALVTGRFESASTIWAHKLRSVHELYAPRRRIAPSNPARRVGRQLASAQSRDGGASGAAHPQPDLDPEADREFIDHVKHEAITTCAELSRLPSRSRSSTPRSKTCC